MILGIIYIPLGGSKNSKINSIRNIFIIFIVSGLAWSKLDIYLLGFISLYAFYHFLILPAKKYKNSVIGENSYFHLLKFLQVVLTFFLVTIGWVFRSETVDDSFKYLNKMFLN